MKIIVFDVSQKTARAKQNMINMLTMYLHHFNNFLGIDFQEHERIRKSSYLIDKDVVVVMYTNKMHRGLALADIRSRFADITKPIEEQFEIVDYDKQWKVEDFPELVFGKKIYLLRQKMKTTKPNRRQTTKMSVLRSMRFLNNKQTWPYAYFLASTEMLLGCIADEMSIEELLAKHAQLINANIALQEKMDENFKEMSIIVDKMSKYYEHS